MKTITIVAALMLGALGWNSVFAPSSLLVSGEGVYISEGCIHCHSQFSRPESLDTDIYGPESSPGSHGEGAVLIGNRRQGPDLSSVGLRRSREWNREHLKDPQKLSPGTRMPSYKHLFEGSAARGEALLDYLANLGVEVAQDWYEQTASWRSDMTLGRAEKGRQLFTQLCQQCHGAAGNGDGELANRFSPRPTHFKSGVFRFAPKSMRAAERQIRLGTIVKYGIPGTAMPGHEYLTDEDIMDLVAYVGAFSVRPDSEK